MAVVWSNRNHHGKNLGAPAVTEVFVVTERAELGVHRTDGKSKLTEAICGLWAYTRFYHVPSSPYNDSRGNSPVSVLARVLSGPNE